MGARGRIAAPVGVMLLGALMAGIAVVMTRVLATAGATLTIAVMVLVAGSAWFASTRRTGVALAFLMVYLGTLDGYLKLSTGSSAVTLVRDVLLYAIVIGLLARSQVRGAKLSLPPLSGWVIAYVVFILVQVPNPNGGTFVHSLAGLRPHLEFVPLFFLGYLTVRDVSSLRRFVLLLILLAVANGIVGYVQFNLSPQQLSAWGPGYAERINGTGAFSGSGRTFVDTSGSVRVRPFGLGSDAGAGGVFGVLALGGIFALTSLIVRLRYRMFAALGGVGAVAAIVTSQGRAVIVAAVATVLAYGVLTATSRRRVASLVGLATAGALAYLVVLSITASAGDGAFRYQGLSASKLLETTASSQGRPGQLHAIASAIVSYPLGAGLGTVGPAAGTGGGSRLTGTLNADSEFSFIVLEAGIPGLIAVVGFTAMLLGVGVTRCRREPDSQARVLLAAAICPIGGILVAFYAGPIVVAVPAGPFLWFVAGLLSYWLITLPRERVRTGLAPRAQVRVC